NFPKELKIGETHAAPYGVQWTIKELGTFIVRAVATYTSGEQQVSPPVVIIVTTEQKPTPASSSVTTADHIKLSTARPALNRTCPNVAETINYRTFLSVGPTTTVNICPDDPDDPLNTFTQLFLRSDVIGGTYSNAPSYEYWGRGGKILKQGAQTIWD